METKYEPIKFDSWKELAKHVIDGGEVYYEKKQKIQCDMGMCNFVLCEHVMNNLYTKKQPTLEELIVIKPRLLWIWKELECKKEIKLVDKYNYKYIAATYCFEILTDDEIKQFLSGE